MLCHEYSEVLISVQAVEDGTQESGIARSSLIVSLMTFISRILGLVREIVFAAVFGDGAAADAFFVAFKIPNFLRRLFAEGAFSQAFVPVLSEYRKKRTFEEIKTLVDHVAGRLSLILFLVTLIGVVAAPMLASVFAWGYRDSPDKFALLVDMLRITFPYILLISLTGFAGSILNSYGRFAVPALTPIFLNLTLIGCALFISHLLAEPVLALAWGVLLAGIIQLMFQLPFLHHLRLMPTPKLKPKHEGVDKVIALMLPVMFSVSVGQINLMLDTFLATWLEGDGAVSWLYYSDRLMELPLGVFAIAIATVMLPALSRLHAAADADKFLDTLDWSLRTLLLVGLPATLALIVLAEPLIVTIYQRGAFSVESVIPTAQALKAYSLGLLGFMSIKVLVTAYFSRQDTSTPVRYAVIAMVCNMVFNLILIIPLAHVGLALATSLSAFLNGGLLLFGLVKNGIYRFRSHWFIYLFQTGLATLAMVIVLKFLGGPADLQMWVQADTATRLIQLSILCFSGALTYILVLLLTGVRLADFRQSV
jgi:putative peptidoglycan lipid II flippase